MRNTLSEQEFHNVLENGNWVRQLARRLLFDESMVDDVVQEVWITALHKPPREPKAMGAWLKKVVRSTCLSSQSFGDTTSTQ